MKTSHFETLLNECPGAAKDVLRELHDRLSAVETVLRADNKLPELAEAPAPAPAPAAPHQDANAMLANLAALLAKLQPPAA